MRAFHKATFGLSTSSTMHSRKLNTPQLAYIVIREDPTNTFNEDLVLVASPWMHLPRARVSIPAQADSTVEKEVWSAQNPSRLISMNTVTALSCNPEREYAAMREFQDTTSRCGILSNTSRTASTLPARRCCPISLFAEVIASQAPDMHAREDMEGPVRRAQYDAARANPSGITEHAAVERGMGSGKPRP